MKKKQPTKYEEYEKQIHELHAKLADPTTSLTQRETCMLILHELKSMIHETAQKMKEHGSTYWAEKYEELAGDHDVKT